MGRKTLLVSGIRLSPDETPENAYTRAATFLRRHGVLADNPLHYEYQIARRAVDARRRQDVHFVCTVSVSGLFREGGVLPTGATVLDEEMPKPERGTAPLAHRPLVVGSGPAGLFAALMLAEYGYRPLLIERGGDVLQRAEAIRKFYSTRVLDTETNVQFGAGGAGTFSDGKLLTRVSDAFNRYVLEQFVTFGAPGEILWQARPHIGTDYLCRVVSNMIDRITALGGEVEFNTRLDGIFLQNGRIVGYTANGLDAPCDAMILAIGHSARDTYRMLLKHPLAIEAKPFSVGMRIEHLQEDIDRALYGNFAGHPALPHAEYAFSAHRGERGVYTFCMCPGGEVMAATSTEGGVVVNGMSEHARSGLNANAALAVSVLPTDFGNTPEGAIQYQEKIEKAAFLAGGGGYTAPGCTVGDFLKGSYGTLPSRVLPTYMGGNDAWRPTDPDLYLPSYVTSLLREGITDFSRRAEGFDAKDAILTGPETRTSAPLRILRNKNRQAVGCAGLYPTGEGAGYAGGITSAALDGLRTAMALIEANAPSV